MLGILARYTVIKEIHPVIREVVGYGEGAALRSAKIGEYILVTIRVDTVTNKIDSIAYGGFMKVENTGISVRNRVRNVNNAVQKRVQFVQETANTATGMIRSVVFVPTHNIFDYAELKLESVMLKKSKDDPKVVPGLINTITKGLDFTYRLNMGLLTSTAKVVREGTKKKTWENL
jgi:hypothetical protein